jgi:hypothetical protein
MKDYGISGKMNSFTPWKSISEVEIRIFCKEENYQKMN